MAVSPAYTIHQYRDDMFKVVAFKGNRDPDVMYVRDREEQQHNDAKLDSNFSRARSMVGLSQILCKHRNAVQIEQNLFKAEVAQAAAALFSK